MSLEHPAREVTPDQCAAELMEGVPAIMQFIRTEMRSQSAALLSVPQFRVLAFLSRYPGSSLSDVADHLGVTRATASAMTERLVQRDFIDRVDDPAHRRQVVLTLTEMGSTYLEQMRATTRGKMAGLLSSLTGEQLSLVLSGMELLNDVFQSAIAKP